MIYEGKAITVEALESGIVELQFDLRGGSGAGGSRRRG
ncbi:hypothetical protein ACIOV9_25760, partial [Pseudomonas iridis]